MTVPPRRVKVLGDLYHGRIPEGAIYVGRGAPGLRASPYANRHRVGDCRTCGTVHDREGAVVAHALDLANRPDLVEAVRRDLHGSDLACWCKPEAGPCHADVLLLVAAGAHPLTALTALGLDAAA